MGLGTINFYITLTIAIEFIIKQALKTSLCCKTLLMFVLPLSIKLVRSRFAIVLLSTLSVFSVIRKIRVV